MVDRAPDPQAIGHGCEAGFGTLSHIQEREILLQTEVLTRFRNDDAATVRAILNDLVESGLVFRSGRGDGTTLRAARPVIPPWASATTTPAPRSAGRGSRWASRACFRRTGSIRVAPRRVVRAAPRRRDARRSSRRLARRCEPTPVKTSSRRLGFRGAMASLRADEGRASRPFSASNALFRAQTLRRVCKKRRRL